MKACECHKRRYLQNLPGRQVKSNAEALKAVLVLREKTCNAGSESEPVDAKEAMRSIRQVRLCRKTYVQRKHVMCLK